MLYYTSVVSGKQGAIMNGVRKTIDDMRALAKSNNGSYVSNTYTNSHTKEQWMCHINDHPIFWMAPTHVQSGQWCPECGKLKSAISRRKNLTEDDIEMRRLRQIELARSSRKTNPNTKEIIRKSKLMTRYDLTLKEYNELYFSQNGVCAICQNTNRTKNLGVDHDHFSGRTRGLLCDYCNSGIGSFFDEEQKLLQAIIYLENNLTNFLFHKAWPTAHNQEYEELLMLQNGRCAICYIDAQTCTRKLAVDHNHNTNYIRGLLCNRCNTGLGRLKDDISIISSAINYLRCWPYMKLRRSKKSTHNP
jgi:hypothetical protein